MRDPIVEAELLVRPERGGGRLEMGEVESRLGMGGDGEEEGIGIGVGGLGGVQEGRQGSVGGTKVRKTVDF